MRVFLDTTPLYALLDARDQGHDRALEVFKRAVGKTLLCPLPTALELHGLMVKRKPSDPSAAHTKLRQVLEVYPLVFPTEADTSAALEMLERYRDQKLSFADTLIAGMAVREGVSVLTFDSRHFSLMGAALYETA